MGRVVYQVTISGLEDVTFSRVQYDIITLLSDGKPHGKREIIKCLYDDLGEDCNVYPHIQKLREKVHPKGYLIMLQLVNNHAHYRLCREL